MLNDFDDMFGFNYTKMIEDEMRQMILTYVPEAEFLGYWDAASMAVERSNEAAEILMESLVEGDVL